MSKSEQIKLKCDECGKEYEATMWHSINVDLNPELREKFFDNSLFNFKCPHCGNEHYIVYPVLYHDMKHNFMVQSGPLSACISFIEQLQSYDEFGDITDSIIKTTATTHELAKEKVVALENGLDHRFATVARVNEVENFKEYAKTIGDPYILGSYLSYDTEGNIIVNVEVYFKEEDKFDIYSCRFDMDYYNKLVRDYKDVLDDTTNYCFNEIVAYRVLNENKMALKLKSKFNFHTYLVLQDFENNVSLALCQKMLDKKLHKGDMVVCEHNGEISNGIIINKTRLFSMQSCPYPNEEIGFAQFKASNSLETTGDSDDELDNDELLIELRKYKEEGKELPYEIINDTDAIVLMEITASIPVDSFDEYGNMKKGDILSDDLKEELEANMKKRIITKEINGKNYLCVYLDQSNVSDNKYTKLIYNLNDLFKIALQSCHEYDGIIINPDEDSIIVENNYILDKYIPNRTMTNDKRMIKLLDSLNDDERKLVGDKALSIISKIYFDNKTPEIIAKEQGIKLSDVGKQITEGYKQLKFVVISRY